MDIWDISLVCATRSDTPLDSTKDRGCHMSYSLQLRTGRLLKTIRPCFQGFDYLHGANTIANVADTIDDVAAVGLELFRAGDNTCTNGTRDRLHHVFDTAIILGPQSPP